MLIAITVNNKPHHLDIPPDKRLIDLLRDDLGLTGTKEGCGEGHCGACSVLLDGTLVNACLILACQLEGSAITTIEGVAWGDDLDEVQRAYLEAGAVQCGFCTPGLILATHALLNDNPHPSHHEVAVGLSGNLCRCTGYQKIFKAVDLAVQAREEKP